VTPPARALLQAQRLVENVVSMREAVLFDKDRKTHHQRKHGHILPVRMVFDDVHYEKVGWAVCRPRVGRALIRPAASVLRNTRNATKSARELSRAVRWCVGGGGRDVCGPPSAECVRDNLRAVHHRPLLLLRGAVGLLRPALAQRLRHRRHLWRLVRAC
jgi:hypothetical protein